MHAYMRWVYACRDACMTLVLVCMYACITLVRVCVCTARHLCLSCTVQMLILVAYTLEALHIHLFYILYISV
jgi:hypothetical protein